MRFLACLFAVSGMALIGLSATDAHGARAKKKPAPMAAEVDEEAADFAKKISKATKWDHLVKAMRPSLTPLVTEEFSTVALEAEFPTIRAKGNQVTLTSTNGERLVITLLGEGGVKFNGRAWELRPLATSDAEINRIADWIRSETAKKYSWADVIVSSAWAAGPGATAGMAAAAYAGANGWKGEACKKDDLSAELARDCSLMAVSMKTAAGPVDKVYYPVSFKCPANNFGVLELIEKNRNGDSYKYEVTFEKGNATIAQLDGAKSNGGFQLVAKIYLDQPKTEREQRFGDAIIGRTQKVYSDVCLGSAADRARYKSQLDANAASLKSNALRRKESDEPNDESIDAS